jgi:hypothetical protein
MSRGYVQSADRYRRDGQCPKPAPLSIAQKDKIERMARDGYRDRQIADELQITEYQVAYWRGVSGISTIGNRGGNQKCSSETMLALALRPISIVGHYGDREWWASNHASFVRGLRKAGGW